MLWTLILIYSSTGVGMVAFPHSFKTETACIKRGEMFKKDVGAVATIRYSCLPNTDPA